MRKAFLAILAVSAVSAGAWMRIDTPLKLQPESRLWVDGTSTTKSFSCKAGAIETDIVATDANATSAVLAGQKAVRKVSVTVPSMKLDCGNGTMNEHMRKAIKAPQFQTIAFSMTGYELAKAADGTKSTITGSLTLGGQTRPITVVATAKDAGAGQLRIAGTYELAMSEFGLKPPSLMFGAMKVGDKVKVGFDLLLKATPAAPVP